MDSKAIADRSDALQYLEAFLDKQGEDLYTAHAEYMAEILEEGEDPPNIRHEIGLLRRRLKKIWQTLEDSQYQLDRWLGKEILLRVDRDSATTSFAAHLTWRRTFLKATFNKLRSDQLLGIKGRVPQKSRALWHQGQLSIHSLRKVAPPEPRPGAPKIDPEEWLEQAEEAFKPLDQAMKGLVQATRSIQTFRNRRDEALEEFNRLFVEFVTILVAYLRLLGHDNMTHDLLPSRQEPGLFRRQMKRRRSYRGRKKKSASGGPSSSS